MNNTADQARQDMRDSADAILVFYNRLKGGGMTADQAFTLTQQAMEQSARY